MTISESWGDCIACGKPVLKGSHCGHTNANMNTGSYYHYACRDLVKPEKTWLPRL